MTSENVVKNYEGNMNAVVDHEHEIKIIPNTLPDSEANSRETLVMQDDQDVIQCPALEEKPPAEDQSQPIDNEEVDIDLLSLPFSKKLWTIVQNESFKSVNWTEEGDTIKIEVDLFQREVLHQKGTKKIFETDSLKGFIHQLNMYGFRKICPGIPVVSPEENKRVMMYRNINFQRDKPGLLEYIWGKEDQGNPIQQTICIPIPLRASREPTSKRKKMLPTRYSPRFDHKHEKEDDEESKKKRSKNQEPKENQCFTFSNVWAMKTIPGCSLEKQSLGESSNPTREDNSRNIICVPQATPEIQGTEEVPSANFSRYTILGSVMSLYDNCCSVIFSALSERPPNETPDEEQEGSSDYKDVICQSIENSPRL
ncbi:heat shock transcription factor, X-linked member 3-like [Mastomys coucha]|uniref:heat shock transcription factor, X-linked member 3-like n=1 Tax=Mastomys coucha TaxID=35658 RepID=UPI001262A948|nr:heat shock transcription factor, X-linked member 3-like [Mastomys coucha]